ncbi:MAG: hypothetical protein R2882_09660 [Gemmatimonadales bacterium]
MKTSAPRRPRRPHRSASGPEFFTRQVLAIKPLERGGVPAGGEGATSSIFSVARPMVQGVQAAAARKASAARVRSM